MRDVCKPCCIVLLLVATPCAAFSPSCGECLTLQEGIYRSIVANISALERESYTGTSQTATLQIGQVIWRM